MKKACKQKENNMKELDQPNRAYCWYYRVFQLKAPCRNKLISKRPLVQ